MRYRCSYHTEYQAHVPYYTVLDHRGTVLIFTTSWPVAQQYIDLALRGHTAQTLAILNLRLAIGPAAGY